jgi:GNAT superfamily N-acetyltransferase
VEVYFPKDLYPEKMRSDALIRQATPLDVELVSDILKEATRRMEQAGLSLWREEMLEPALIAPDVDAGQFFIAECAGDSAGTIKFQLEDPVVWTDAREQDAAYIHRLAVRTRYAGTGLSTELLRWAVRRTQSLDRQYLRLDCHPQRPRLREIYEDFGFRHHSDVPVGGLICSRYEYDVSKPFW